nr:zinc finger, CCHC-type [Tanacetum cinerariifolium]
MVPGLAGGEWWRACGSRGKWWSGAENKEEEQAKQELLQTTRDFHSCKQEEGQSVSSHVLKIKGYIDNLERLRHPVTLGLAVSLILIGLCKEFDDFVQNYNMHSLRKIINELHAMLKLHEQTLSKNKAPGPHAIRAVFQKEVENQLGKTIKSLRSDHGDEYMSQEFSDHLKDHRIIAHRTPSYTPQHNGVSERRNTTLLDMVEKTPYEVWHGQASKLSYLKVWSGYPKEMMGYSFYYPPENNVLVARNAEFLENGLITQEASESLEALKII